MTTESGWLAWSLDNDQATRYPSKQQALLDIYYQHADWRKRPTVTHYGANFCMYTPPRRGRPVYLMSLERLRLDPAYSDILEAHTIVHYEEKPT